MSENRKKNSHGGKRPGAGRKPTADENKVLVAVRIPPALRTKLDKWAAGNDVNRTEAVEEAIRRLTHRK